MKTLRRLIVATTTLAATALACACSYDDLPPSSAAKADVVPQSCATIKGWSFVRDTVLAKCGGSACHDPGNTEAVVILAPESAYANIVGVDSRELPSMQLVEPGRPSRSFLFHKLSASQAEACETSGVNPSRCGAQMPLNDWFALPDAWTEETRAWIACGARP
jgi:hypothetical protein